jgi:hypothetical protein
MQILCKASTNASDIRCNVCGQGFLVYWTHTSTAERSFAHDSILAALRGHHLGSEDASVHPMMGFSVPEWGGEVGDSAAGLPGNPPAWATT